MGFDLSADQTSTTLASARDCCSTCCSSRCSSCRSSLCCSSCCSSSSFCGSRPRWSRCSTKTCAVYDASVVFPGVPECHAQRGVWGFATAALCAESAPNVASHADNPLSMPCPGLYKRITFVVVVVTRHTTIALLHCLPPTGTPQPWPERSARDRAPEESGSTTQEQSWSR